MALDDPDLRDRFAALRREEAAQAPDFALLLGRKTTPRRPWRVRGFAAAAALIVVAVVLWFRFYPSYPRPPAVSLSITEWRSPTDLLLQTPGDELLESVPRVGAWPDSLAFPQRTPAPTGRKKVEPNKLNQGGTKS